MYKKYKKKHQEHHKQHSHHNLPPPHKEETTDYFQDIMNFIGWIFFGPSPPRKLKLTILTQKGNLNMNTALVKFTWLKSPSDDVVNQHLKVVVVGQEVPVLEVDLPPSVEESVVIELTEKSQVHVELTASDGVYTSSAAVLDFALGDLVAPEAPTNLGYTIVERIVEPPVPPIEPVV